MQLNDLQQSSAERVGDILTRKPLSGTLGLEGKMITINIPGTLDEVCELHEALLGFFGSFATAGSSSA